MLVNFFGPAQRKTSFPLLSPPERHRRLITQNSEPKNRNRELEMEMEMELELELED